MSLKRNDPKRDSNEAKIVMALEQAGAFVTRLSEKGTPDLLVLFRGGIYLLEVKRTPAN